MWNNRAKERALKKQFTAHAKNHIFKRRIITAEESAQTMENSLLNRKENFLDCLEVPKEKIGKQIVLTRKQIEDIERIQGRSKVLKNKSDWIFKSVDRFADKYIGNSSWVAAKGLGVFWRRLGVKFFSRCIFSQLI